MANFQYGYRAISTPGFDKATADWAELHDLELEDYLNPTPWVKVSTFGFTSPWTDFDTTRQLVIRRVGDIVYLEGIVKTTAAVNYNSPVVTLPVEYRPARTVQVGPGFSHTTAAVVLELATTGVLTATEWTPAPPLVFAYVRISGFYSLSGPA